MIPPAFSWIPSGSVLFFALVPLRASLSGASGEGRARLVARRVSGGWFIVRVFGLEVVAGGVWLDEDYENSIKKF